MSRKKRVSSHLADANTRLAGIKSIDPTNPDLDLGNGYSAKNYEVEIDDFDTTLERYNMLLSEIDALLNAVNVKEKKLKVYSARMLDAVKLKYGADSDEYEKAGGKRTSERKRPRRNPPKGNAGNG